MNTAENNPNNHHSLRSLTNLKAFQPSIFLPDHADTISSAQTVNDTKIQLYPCKWIQHNVSSHETYMDEWQRTLALHCMKMFEPSLSLEVCISAEMAVLWVQLVEARSSFPF
jgi:hypothetical protein